MSTPSIQKEIDEASLNRYEFRILATISRRAGRRGSCYESVPHMAARCRMGERTAQRALKTLTESGFISVVRPATPNSPAHYAPTRRVHLDKHLLKIFVPASLDDAGLTPEALRLFYHYCRWSWDGEVEANHARAARTCGAGLTTRASAIKFEAELCAAGLLEPRGRAGKRRVFGIGERATVHEVRPVEDATTAEPFTRRGPTVHEVRPDRSRGADEGSLEGSLEGINDAPKKESHATILKDILGKRTKWFKTYFTENHGVGVLDAQLAKLTADQLRRAWTIIEREPTPRERPGMPREMARAFTLMDALSNQLRRDDPPALHTLRAEIDRSGDRPKIVLPQVGSVVRYNGSEWAVDSAAGRFVFLDGLDAPVDPRACEPVQNPRLKRDETPAERPWFVVARERRAHQQAAA